MTSVGSPEVAAALIAGTVALAGSLLTLAISIRQLRHSENKLRQEAIQAAKAHQLGEEKLRREYQLEFAAERVARALLEDARWEQRTFGTIKRHLGGFADDELRKLLVRAGAIRFSSKSGDEIWGLLDRNRAKLGLDALDNLAPALSAIPGIYAAPASGPEFSLPPGLSGAAAPALEPKSQS
jgi:hypothetical protein